jgi:peptidoglycan-associated lipoprotein
VPEAKPAPPPAPAKEPLQDVFFDFDKSNIRPDGKQSLDANIQWLKANSAVRIRVEGHCDERGTNEYNLALGERRARATRDYLVAGGIDAKRISTVSYGEERPFVQGHDESAWKWNRRGHFVIVK